MSARTRPERDSAAPAVACPFHDRTDGEVVLFARTARRGGDAPAARALAAPAGRPACGEGTESLAPFTPDDVQSNVVRSVNPQQAHYLFFRIVDAAAARRLIATLVDPPPADPAEGGTLVALPPDDRRFWSEAKAHRYDAQGNRRVAGTTWNVAFTWPGLVALGVDRNTLDSFPEDFRDGMAARAERLGDVGDSAPEHWDGWLGSREVHGVLMVSLQAAPDIEQGDDDLPARLEVGMARLAPGGKLPGRAAVEDLIDDLAASGLRILHAEVGERIASPLDPAHRIEHFGFRDGISQPFAGATLDTPRPPPAGGGTARPDGSWDPIARGELLLGWPDEDGLMQARPAHPDLRLNGTYMVFRKLEQDVVGFRRYLAEHGGATGRESLLAAQMMGRWPDGTSLVKSPDGATQGGGDRTINDFRYGTDDPRGQHCPLGSHVRRVNPRDSNGRDEARRHRIWRRSITYGDFLPYGAPGDGQSRGILFVAMCARIDQQFEFLQTRWINTGEFIGQAGLARCPISGANRGDVQDSFAVAGRPAPYTHVPRFVKALGGDYFFVPSLPALARLAAGDDFATPPGPELVNPSLDRTPKIDLEALVQLGRKALLPDGAPPWLEVDPHLHLVLVGRHDLVTRVLADDRRFALTETDRRMRQICGGEQLMLGMPEGDPERTRRMRMWADAAVPLGTQSWSLIARQAMQKILRRHGPTGAIDLVRHVSLVVPMALAQAYFGVTGPNWVSPAFIASQFAKAELSQVPRDWLRALPTVAPQDMAYTTLQAWAQTAFAQVFVNVVNAADLTGLARRTTEEFFRHLDGLIATIRAGDNRRRTLLENLVALDPTAYGLDTERFDKTIRLLVAELIVGSAGTLAQALPNFMDVVMDHADWIQPGRYADAEIDGLVREALRFNPVAPALFRTCTEDTDLGGRVVPKGSLVAVLLKTAMFDPRVFPDPDRFSTGRDPASYLVFGTGMHACKGASIAEPVLREMVKPLLALPDLHRAAGSRDLDRDPLNRWQHLKARFRPVAPE